VLGRSGAPSGNREARGAQACAHFVADDPALALVDSWPSASSTPKAISRSRQGPVALRKPGRRRAGKLKRPAEWIVGSLRADGVNVDGVRPVVQAQNLLGEPLWRPPAPNGFADDDATWLDGCRSGSMSPTRCAAASPPPPIRRPCFEEALAPDRVGRDQATDRARESRPQALALLLMAPEFNGDDCAGRNARARIAPVRWQQRIMTPPPCSNPTHCCSPPARCSPGPICRRSRVAEAAIRASS
jgi:uncharacterized membrane protein